MAKSVVDTVPDSPVDRPDLCFAEAPAGDNTAERDRQAKTLLPPLAKILQADQASLPVREAGFVDDDSCVHLTFADGIHDQVKAHLHQLATLGEKHLQEKRRGGQFAGNGNPLAGKLAGLAACPGYQQGAAAPPQGTAGGQDTVLVENMTQGMTGEFGDIKLCGQCPQIELFHVFQERRTEDHVAHGNLTVNQGIEDKGVVGTGRKPQREIVLHTDSPLMIRAAARPASRQASCRRQLAGCRSST
ncbi:MAG: hypothetical protein ACD_75C01760G0001 [uncultured bacterium]|nr:MAG: hypothetical protein ACD_75C01760G0001 [uncultured bacterium]